MSMVLDLVTVSRENIANIRHDAPLVWRFLAPDDPDAYLESKGLSVEDDATPVPDLAMASGEGLHHLASGWHAIHFLLTGNSAEGDFPLGFILAGGAELSEIDAGYGPPRILSPQETLAVNQALTSISAEELCGRLDLKAMAQARIYPNTWMTEPEASSRIFIREEFVRLAAFVQKASADGLGLILSIA